jgi:hypothetical protein
MEKEVLDDSKNNKHETSILKDKSYLNSFFKEKKDTKKLSRVKNNPDNVNKILKNQENKIQTKLAEKKYRKLSTIINNESMLSFVKLCVTLESVALFYYAYNLIVGFNDITQFVVAFLYFLDYVISLFNVIIYLRYIIQYKEESKSKSNKINVLLKLTNKKSLMKTKSSRKSNVKDTLRRNKSVIGFVIHEDDENQKSIKYLVFFIYFRISSWVVKYILYLIVLFKVSKINIGEYFKIPILFVEYFLYHLLKFYVKVLLRLKRIKVEYDLKIED